MTVVVLLFCSCVFQLTAAVFALLLIPVSRKKLPWILLAGACFLMAARRVIPLYSISMGQAVPSGQVMQETIGLIVSAMMLAGVALIRPVLAAVVRSREELRESEQKYRLITDRITDIAWTADLDGHITFISPSVEAVLGYTPEEAADLGVKGLLAPESYREASSFFKQRLGAARGDPGTPLAPITTEYTHIAKTGRRVVCEATNQILRNDEDEPVGVIGITRDITERKRSEDALRESERRFREMAELLPEVVAEMDRDGLITFVNRQAPRVFGYCRQEWNDGINVRQLFAEEEWPRVRAAMDEALAGQLLPNREYSMVRKDGTAFPAIANCSAVVEDGLAVGLRAMAIDVSEMRAAQEERRRLEEKMQQAQKLESLAVLAGGVAHDFNNILMSILGNADLALMELPPEAPGRACVREIETAAKRAADLASQMLAYSGAGNYKVEELDLSRLVDGMAHLLRATVTPGVVMKTECPEGLPMVNADASQVRQVVVNLVTNASEAIGEGGGLLTVKTGAMEVGRSYLRKAYMADENEPGEYVFLEVSDTGCGMDAETLAKVFDPFYTTKFPGRGLGLAAVLGIVRAHGGVIRADSQPGQGSAFRVLFPPARSDLKVPAEEPAASAPAARRTVLLVDDQDAVRNVGRNMLDRLGYRPLIASGGFEAIDLFREHHQDIVCVVLDLTMPELDGVETFRELQRLDSSIPVVLSSGYQESDAIRRMGPDEVAGFIQKPYRFSALKAKLREVTEPARRPSPSPGSVSTSG